DELGGGTRTFSSRVGALKALLIEELASIPDVYVNGAAGSASAGHIVNLSFPGVRGEVLVHELASAGVYVSTGSACSSRSRSSSHVLRALGISPERLESSIRISLADDSTTDEVRV